MKIHTSDVINVTRLTTEVAVAAASSESPSTLPPEKLQSCRTGGVTITSSASSAPPHVSFSTAAESAARTPATAIRESVSTTAMSLEASASTEGRDADGCLSPSDREAVVVEGGACEADEQRSSLVAAEQRALRAATPGTSEDVEALEMEQGAANATCTCAIAELASSGKGHGAFKMGSASDSSLNEDNIRGMQSELNAHVTVEKERQELLQMDSMVKELQLELVRKSAELEGIRAFLAQMDPLRRQLEEERAGRARAESALLDEKSMRIRDLKKTAQLQQAAFFTAVNMNPATLAAFMSNSGDDPDTT